jgi:hypothetical protein
LIAAETLYSSHYFDARLQLLGLYTDTENREQTYDSTATDCSSTTK